MVLAKDGPGRPTRAAILSAVDEEVAEPGASTVGHSDDAPR
jgi:hypothetical protein